jgi:hypothetical protein
MALFIDPKLYGLETMTLEQQIERLTALCMSEREAFLSGQWTYEVARHRGYHRLLKKAIERRDIEAIDKAFERAGQRILEAAE